MRTHNPLAPWVRRFLLEHLVAERNLARSTQMSYRDTLALLLPFVSQRSGIAVDRLSVAELSPTIVRLFLDHIEKDRCCSVTTRNQRLGAIHSLASSAAEHRNTWLGALHSLQEDRQDDHRVSREGRA